MRNENGCIRVFADKKQIDRSKNRLGQVNSSIQLLSKILNLAGNEVRLQILYLLFEENELCVCDLSDILDMKAPAVSQHLRKMKDAAIIDNRKDGQTIYYKIIDQYLELLEPYLQLISKNKVLRKVS